MSDVKDHSPVPDDAPRDWIKRDPIWKPVIEDRPFCPWCGEEIDSLEASNGSDKCKCGRWSHGNVEDWGAWFFRRSLNESEKARLRQDEAASLRLRLDDLLNEETQP